jgi:hypothetical protein
MTLVGVGVGAALSAPVAAAGAVICGIDDIDAIGAAGLACGDAGEASERCGVDW